MNHLSRAALASIVGTTSNLTLRSALSKAWPSHAGAGRATVAWIMGTAQREVSRKTARGTVARPRLKKKANNKTGKSAKRKTT